MRRDASAGATASGKSALAHALALRLGSRDAVRGEVLDRAAACERFELPQTEEPATLRAGNAGSLYFAVNGQTYGPAGQGRATRGGAQGHLVVSVSRVLVRDASVRLEGVAHDLHGTLLVRAPARLLAPENLRGAGLVQGGGGAR